MKAPLPKYMPQTAASAEHYAMLLAALHAVPGSDGNTVRPVTDCRSVLVALANVTAATHYSKSAAGLWRHLP